MVLVSIVTPLFNSQDTISETIESVLGQTFSDWEMIIVDDCSTDDSEKIVSSYIAKDARLKYIKLTRNSGPACARNVAISEAKGRYIAFLDSDDKWLSHKLETQIDFIRKKKAGLVFSAYMKRHDDGVVSTVNVPEVVSYKSLLKCCVIGCLTAVYDTAKHGKVYMPEIRKRQDFGLWLRLLKTMDYAYGQNEVLAEYSVRKGSISSNKLSAALYQWKIYRKVEKIPIYKSLYYFIHYSVRGVLRSRR